MCWSSTFKDKDKCMTWLRKYWSFQRNQETVLEDELLTIKISWKKGTYMANASKIAKISASLECPAQINFKEGRAWPSKLQRTPIMTVISSYSMQVKFQWIHKRRLPPFLVALLWEATLQTWPHFSRKLTSNSKIFSRRGHFPICRKTLFNRSSEGTTSSLYILSFLSFQTVQRLARE